VEEIEAIHLGGRYGIPKVMVSPNCKAITKMLSSSVSVIFQ
jgi:hypothetical protein